MSPALSALALYTGLLGLIATWLFGNVGKIKNEAKVFMGDGDPPVSFVRCVARRILSRILL